MGNWHMSVDGVGAHHNKYYPQDANRMFEDFVAKLKEAGHTLSHASFTYGAAQQLHANTVSGPTHPLEVEANETGCYVQTSNGRIFLLWSQLAEIVAKQPAK